MFAPRGSLGISWLTNSFHPVHNPDNRSYSLPIGAYLQVGLVLHFKVTGRFTINASANYQHISNGGVKDPNRGINWPTASAGLSYRINDAEFKEQEYHPSKRFTEKNRIETGLYASGIIIEKGEKQVYPVVGLFLAYHRRLNNLHSISAGADLHLDLALSESQRRANEEQYYHFTSLLIGHEFLMGDFEFLQQIGHYVTPPDERFINWYHRWGLNYALSSSFSLGVSLKAHLHMAHFADVRVCYNINY
jgi:hypothetical protein